MPRRIVIEKRDANGEASQWRVEQTPDPKPASEVWPVTEAIAAERIRRDAAAMAEKSAPKIAQAASAAAEEAVRKVLAEQVQPVLEAMKQAAIAIEAKKPQENWLSDYGIEGREASGDARKKRNASTPGGSPSVDDKLQKHVERMVAQLTQAVATLGKNAERLNDPKVVEGLRLLMRKRALQIVKRAEAVATLESVNKGRMEQGLDPFDVDIVRHWRPGQYRNPLAMDAAQPSAEAAAAALYSWRQRRLEDD